MKNPKLDKFKKEISEFEKNAGFEKTSKKQLVKWIKREVRNYEKFRSKKIRENKLLDIIVLVMQIAKREKISFDRAWVGWCKKSERYLK